MNRYLALLYRYDVRQSQTLGVNFLVFPVTMVLFICLLSLVVLVVARQKLYTSSYLLEATSYFFVTIEDQTFQISSNSLAKCLSSKNYNLSAFWKRSDRWKFTSLQSCVSLDLAPQIGWKLYILLPAMLLHGPEMWGGLTLLLNLTWLSGRRPLTSISPSSLLPHLPGLACNVGNAGWNGRRSFSHFHL